jgi:tetratricopeptide (TPR) repeat protein
MQQQDIQRFRKQVTEYLSQRRVHDAFVALRKMSESAMAWEITDDINRVEQGYAYMLRYVTEGVVDPSRNEVYESIINDVYRLLDIVERRLYAVETPTLYYSEVRNNTLKRDCTILSLVNSYKQEVDKVSLFNQAVGSGNTTPNLSEIEDMERRMFVLIWTTFPFKIDDEEAVNDLLTSDLLSDNVKALIVSALMLGILQYFDERRFNLLLNAYESTSVLVSCRALVAILLALYKYSNRPLSKKLNDRLSLITDTPEWQRDVKEAFIEFIRTRDTDRINKKMTDEVIPQMMKMRPDLMDKINDSLSKEELMSLEENPEWEDMLNKSGITDKLKELSELQQEGSDVMMSTFSHLKSFPFFSNIANWFLPFSLEHTAVSHIFGDDTPLIMDVIEQAPFLCNSDKYSFMLSLGSMPSAQRDMMLQQIDAQRQQLAEAKSMAEMLIDKQSRQMTINKYLHDIYRFFKLFRRKGEFYDPFDQDINLIKVDRLSKSFEDVESLKVIAEYYFKYGCYSDALEVFGKLLDQCEFSVEIFQKTGYCNEKLGNLDQAIQNYEQSELFNAENKWTLKRLASCYKIQGNTAKALEYYERLSRQDPDNLSITMHVGNCLTELERYDEAIKQYYKVQFLDENSTRVLRPLAWCLFMTGDYQNSCKFYDKAISSNAISEDYLNKGHVALASGNFAEALKNYKQCVAMNDGNVDTFLKLLNKYIPYLQKVGIDVNNLPLISDAMFY